jgi:signal transduction histidine kinase
VGSGSELELWHEERRGVEETLESGWSRTVCEKALREEQCVLSRDTAHDERFAEAMSLAGAGVRSVMCAPLRGREGVLGLLYLDTTSGESPFRRGDLRLLSTVAADIALGLDNARLRSERIRMERLAAVGQAIAGLAHCVKNVLNTINCGSYLVDKGLEGQDWSMVGKGWELMGTSNKFLHRMVLDMLAFSKPRKPSYEETDLTELLRGVADSCQMFARDNHVELVLDAPEDGRAARVDPVAMQRCLYNLVTNAIEACRDVDRADRRVTLSWSPGEEGFEIAVSDNGAGMSAQVKSSLFQAFFSTKGSKGTGLGLPVVAKTVEEHRGAVEVESEEGSGTRFVLRLPWEGRGGGGGSAKETAEMERQETRDRR